MRHLFATLTACLAFAAAGAQGYHMEGMEVKPESNIVFETGTANIKPESEAALRNIKKYLDDKTYITLLRIEGHVDGGAQDQKLSEARANAIAKWLVSAGVDCKRLIPVGFGNTKPVSEIKAANNRIAFCNAALKGHAIGGMPADGGGAVAGDPCK
jgi:OOP family OmpA-OmpF porin